MTDQQKRIIDELVRNGTASFTEEKARVLGYRSRQHALEVFDEFGYIPDQGFYHPITSGEDIIHHYDD